MGHKIRIEGLFPTTDQNRAEDLSLLALINLGLIESLANGSIGAAEAVERFYFADNCLFVRKHFKDKIADRIMSHGVQLPDLFDCLPVEEAQREFLRELAVMRRLCFELLETKRRVA